MVHLNPGQPPPLSIHVASQLIFKIISVQKFSILVLKFKEFLKNTLKLGFAHFLAPYSYKQSPGRNSYKTAFTNINKVSSSSILFFFFAIIYSWKANRGKHNNWTS